MFTKHGLSGIQASQTHNGANKYKGVGIVSAFAAQTNNSDQYHRITINSSGTVFTAVANVPNGSNTQGDVQPMVFDEDLNCTLSIGLHNSNVTATGNFSQASKIANSGNIYVTYNYNNAAGGVPSFLVKLNSAGVVQWTRRFSSAADTETASTVNTTIYAVELDSSENVYVGGFVNAVRLPFVSKYDTNGTLLWSTTYNPSGWATSTDVRGIALDPSGNVWITIKSAYFNAGLSVLKLNPATGAILNQWISEVIGADLWYIADVKNPTIDSSGNVYVTAKMSRYPGGVSDNSTYIAIFKFSNTATLTWIRTLATSTFSTLDAKFITADSSGNVYVGITESTTVSYLVKLNTSGNVVWKNSLILEAGFPTGYIEDMAIHPNGNLYLTTTMSGQTDIFTINPDGSTGVSNLRGVLGSRFATYASSTVLTLGTTVTPAIVAGTNPHILGTTPVIPSTVTTTSSVAAVTGVAGALQPIVYA
jgi:hypothetical protein